MNSLPGQPHPTSLSNPVHHGQAPVRKPSRPSSRAEAQVHARQAPVNEPIHRQPLSSSTSPQLANMLSHPSKGHHRPSIDAVLPSPSPSEDTSSDNVPIPTPGPSGILPHVSPQTVHADGALQATTALKRPLAATERTTPSNKRTQQSTNPRPRPAPPSLDTQNTDAVRWEMAQPVSGGRTQASPNSDHVPFYPTISQHANTQSPYQQQLTPQSIPGQPQHQRLPGPPQQQPLPNQVIAPNTWPQDFIFLRETLLQNLLNIRRTLGTNEHVLLDAQRLTALDQATADWDWDYLVTHQFYCLLTIDPRNLPEYVRSSPNVPATAAFFTEILDANDKLMPGMKNFFMNFPIPIQQLHQYKGEQRQRDLSQFVFLMRRAASYQTLKQKCDERSAPPSMYELVHDMGITSKHFQQMIFTASIRRLWRKWGLERADCDLRSPFEAHAMQFLVSMQSNFGYQPGRKREKEILVNGFRALREAYTVELHQALQNMQAAFQRPVLENPLNRPPSQPPFVVSDQSAMAHQLVSPNSRISQGRNSQVSLPQHLVLSSNAPSPTQVTFQHGQGGPRGGSHPATHVLPPRLQLQVQPHIEPRMQPYGSLQHLPYAHIQTQQYPQTRPSLRRQAPHLPPSVPTPKSIFPPRHVLAQHQRVPNPARFGLHQAHLRDARLKHQSGESFHLYVQSFLLEPRRLTEAGHEIERWTFTITPDQFARIPQDIPGSMGSPPSRIVDEKSILLRLRCAQWTAANPPDEHAWATAKMSWVPYSFFGLNGKNLELRKKLHYGNDRPIDLTHLVKEGENMLDITVLSTSNNHQYREYLLAIEILGVQTHDKLMKDIVANNHISAATTKQRIKEKLSPSMDDEDDDIMVLNKTLTVQLTDPFLSANMPATPARSKACDHFQCFELATFLKTRNKDGDCTVADHWKCPICSGDARPQHLIVDGFVEEVREKLNSQGLQNTRAIVVNEDGSWKPKAEVLEGVADPNDDDAPVNPGAQKKGSAPHSMNVIDLGDSDDD